MFDSILSQNNLETIKITPTKINFDFVSHPLEWYTLKIVIDIYFTYNFENILHWYELVGIYTYVEGLNS